MSEWIASGCLLAGGFFCLVAGIGIIRLKDVFARMHAATKAGTLGLALVCVAVMIKAESWIEVVEAAFVFGFMILSTPVGAHLICRAAYRRRQPMTPGTQADDDAKAFQSLKG